jgi:hypothetical protein
LITPATPLEAATPVLPELVDPVVVLVEPVDVVPVVVVVPVVPVDVVLELLPAPLTTVVLDVCEKRELV